MAPRNLKNLSLDPKANPHIHKNASRVSKPPSKLTTTNTTNPHSRLGSLLNTYTRTVGEDGGVTTRLNETTTMTSAALAIHSRNELIALEEFSLGLGLENLAFRLGEWEVEKGEAEKGEEADDEAEEDEAQAKNENKGTSGVGPRSQGPLRAKNDRTPGGYCKPGDWTLSPPPTPAPWAYVSDRERLEQYQLQKIEEEKDEMKKYYMEKAFKEAKKNRAESKAKEAAKVAKAKEAAEVHKAKNAWKNTGSKGGLRAGEFSRHGRSVDRYPECPPPAPGPPLTPSPPGSPVGWSESFVPAQRKVYFIPPTDPALIARLNRKNDFGPSDLAATPPPVGDEFAQLGESSGKMQQNQGAPGVTVSTQVASAQTYSNTNNFTLPFRPKQPTVATESQENNSGFNNLPRTYRNGFNTSAQTYSNTNNFTLPFRLKQQLPVEDLPMEEEDLPMEGNIPPRAMSPDWTKDPLDPRNR
jgi:hypothetical protein